MSTRSVSPRTSPATSATSTRFWRDRGFWLQLVIQCAVFLFFGITDVSNAFYVSETLPAVILTVGYTLVFVGLLVQRWRPEVGLAVVAVGMVLAAAGMSGIYFLAYLVVCYESWFISAFIRQRRGMWLALLLTGSVVSVVVFVLTEVYGVQPADALEPGGMGETGFILVVLVLVAVLSIGLFAWARPPSPAGTPDLGPVNTAAEPGSPEMHDMVAHSLTAVIAQAVADATPAQDPREPSRAGDQQHRAGPAPCANSSCGTTPEPPHAVPCPTRPCRCACRCGCPARQAACELPVLGSGGGGCGGGPQCVPHGPGVAANVEACRADHLPVAVGLERPRSCGSPWTMPGQQPGRRICLDGRGQGLVGLRNAPGSTVVRQTGGIGSAVGRRCDNGV